MNGIGDGAHRKVRSSILRSIPAKPSSLERYQGAGEPVLYRRWEDGRQRCVHALRCRSASSNRRPVEDLYLIDAGSEIENEHFGGYTSLRVARFDPYV